MVTTGLLETGKWRDAAFPVAFLNRKKLRPMVGDNFFPTPPAKHLPKYLLNRFIIVLLNDCVISRFDLFL